MFQSLPSDFEQHALLGVHLHGFAGGDVEEFRVKGVDVGQERPPPRGAGECLRYFSGAILEWRPPIRRHFRHRGPTLAQKVPVLLRAVDPTGESAAQADHRDRLVGAASTLGLVDRLGGGFGPTEKLRQVSD